MPRGIMMDVIQSCQIGALEGDAAFPKLKPHFSSKCIVPEIELPGSLHVKFTTPNAQFGSKPERGHRGSSKDEAQYVTPHEYTWCQTHPTECNMYNNASYREYIVSGTTNFAFTPDGSTARTKPAIRAWTGATVNRIEPDPGNDGIWFMGYKVTNPSAGVWNYEYALFNETSIGRSNPSVCL